jgi:hypothetical protein
MSSIRLKVAEPLRFFLAPRHRRGAIELVHDGTSSLGHVVESVGVPLPEVGRLVVNGQVQPPHSRPRPGDAIDVAPVGRPQPLDGPAAFLLDVHLGTLARRLRLLGIDAAYHADADDDTLVDVATESNRLLLTKDRGLLRRRAPSAAGYAPVLRRLRTMSRLRSHLLARRARSPTRGDRCHCAGSGRRDEFVIPVSSKSL